MLLEGLYKAFNCFFYKVFTRLLQGLHKVFTMRVTRFYKAFTKLFTRLLQCVSHGFYNVLLHGLCNVCLRGFHHFFFC